MARPERPIPPRPTLEQYRAAMAAESARQHEAAMAATRNRGVIIQAALNGFQLVALAVLVFAWTRWAK